MISYTYKYKSSSQKFPIFLYILNTKTIESTNYFESSYINYIISIITPYKSWEVLKRYTDFANLHIILSKKYNFLDFPPFPPKRLFKFSESTITERKIHFEEYLNFIIKKINIFKSPEIIEFLDIDNQVIEIFFKNNSMLNQNSQKDDINYYNVINSLNSNIKISSSLNSNNSSSGNKSPNINNNLDCKSNKSNKSNDDKKFLNLFDENNYFISFEEFKLNNINKININFYIINEFLRNLDEQREHIVNIVKTFLEYLKYKNKWKKLNKEEINRLFLGGNINDFHKSEINIEDNKNNNTDKKNNLNNNTIKNCVKKNLNGLFYHIGKFNKNYYGSKSCLILLNKLINAEFNPEYEIYINVLKQKKLDEIKIMNLIEFSKINNYRCQEYVFNILYNLVDNFNSIDKKKTFLNEVGGEEKFIEKFMKWIKNKNDGKNYFI